MAHESVLSVCQQPSPSLLCPGCEFNFLVDGSVAGSIRKGFVVVKLQPQP